MRFLEKVVGNYELIRFINEGGWAYVYEARHQTLPKRVAVKVLKEIFSHDKSQCERFVREAMILSGLDHPNIVKVLDISTIDGILAIIMEYLEGRDLKEYLRESGPMDLNSAKALFLQLLDALEYAHNRGVYHRDINPSNVFLVKGDSVKILDFGIAKITDNSVEGTRTGTAMGTPAFMSPEQIKAEKNIDGRSDIYSLGVTLFTMLNGKHPYVGMESHFDIQSKVVLEPLPQLTNCLSINPIIKKATKKKKEERFQNIAEFRKMFLSAFETENDQLTIVEQKEKVDSRSSDYSVNSEKKQKGKVDLENNEDTGKNSKKPAKIILLIGLIGIALSSFWFIYSNTEPVNHNVERQVRTEVQRRGQILVGLLTLEAIDDEMRNRFSRVFGANKEIIIVRCTDFDDLVAKVNQKSVDVAVLTDNEFSKSQSTFDLTMSDIQCKDNSGNSVECRIAVPKGNDRLLDQLDASLNGGNLESPGSPVQPTSESSGELAMENGIKDDELIHFINIDSRGIYLRNRNLSTQEINTAQQNGEEAGQINQETIITTLHDGTKVRLISAVGKMYYVEVPGVNPNGLRGYISKMVSGVSTIRQRQ